MKIEVRSDHVLISGYVNAVGRDSRPLPSPTGKFVEMVEPGVFRAALERAVDVQLLLNHDKSRVLGSVAQGNLALCEDNIGLRAECTVTDADVIEKARKGELRGWSFGMYVNNADMEERADNIPRRHLRDIDIFEVSLIDKSKLPCYAGTSVECRADSEIMAETRSVDDEAEIKCLIPPDLSDYERRLNDIYLRAYERRLAELRYNPYHDPTNGRFTSGSGGAGGGVLFVGKGQKGKGAYVFDRDIDAEYEEWKKSRSAAKGDTESVSIISGHIANMNTYNDYKNQKGIEAAEAYKKRIEKYENHSFVIDAPKITGKTEKQIKYASDLRERELLGQADVVKKQAERLGIDHFNPNSPVYTALDKEFEKNGVSNMGEYTKKYVEGKAKHLLALTDARDIIDYYDAGGISGEKWMSPESKKRFKIE